VERWERGVDWEARPDTGFMYTHAGIITQTSKQTPCEALARVGLNKVAVKGSSTFLAQRQVVDGNPRGYAPGILLKPRFDFFASGFDSFESIIGGEKGDTLD
jgi:hypothetical protein